jgi:tetratricopeptide (TPR) repeat protein
MPDQLDFIPFPSEEQSELERILYISLPEDIENKLEGFVLDPSIPLPVEPPPGVKAPDLSSLSWEMIVSAMLKIFAWQPDHPHIEYFRRFITTVHPELANEMTRAAIIKARTGQFEIAEELFRALVNLRPDQDSSFVNLATLFEEEAEALTKEGLEEEAEEKLRLELAAYHRGIEFHPDSAPLRYSAGLFFLQRGNPDKAREHFARFLELEPEGSERREEAAQILRELKARSLEEEGFKEAFDLIRMGREDKGIEKVRGFLENNPGVWNAWFLLGWGLRKTGVYDKALEAFDKSIEFNPSNPDSFNERAICSMELGRFGAAEKDLKSALKLEPENTKIISNLGILALKKGDPSLARAYFQTVLEYDPGDPVAAQYLDKLELHT